MIIRMREMMGGTGKEISAHETDEYGNFYLVAQGNGIDSLLLTLGISGRVSHEHAQIHPLDEE